MSARDSPTRIVVQRPMNNHRTMTVELRDTNETRHICEYATPELKRRLALLSAEAEILVTMSRIGIRANVWRAMAVVENGSVEPVKTAPDTRTG